MPIYLEYMGYSVEVPHGETIVGRHVSCALRFDDSAVSRKHVRFVRTGNDVFAEDLGSTNGTMLNGKLLLERTRLADGDAIEVGGYCLELRVVDPEVDEVSTRRLATLNELGRIQKSPTVPPVPAPGSIDPPTEPLHERRRSDRRLIEIPIVYTSAELELEVTTRDLSTSGVFVCSQVLEPVGTRCELAIHVEGREPLQVRGIVRRVVESEQEGAEGVGLGIEFVELGTRERVWLEGAIARLAEAS